jgi:hypothetical protein
MITITVLETPHAIVGAAIATKVVHPALAIPLAFASHFMLEKVPHWNPHLNTETEKFGRPTKQSTTIVVIDAVTALASGSYLAYRALPNQALALTIFIACFSAVLPDIIEGPYFFLNLRNATIKRWVKFQKSLQVDTEVIPGLLTQVATVAAALWWILQ